MGLQQGAGRQLEPLPPWKAMHAAQIVESEKEDG